MKRKQNMAFVIAEKGKSGYRIVIPRKASKAQRHAAEELAKFIRLMSGAKLPVVTDKRPPKPCEILLGDNNRLKPLGIKPDWKKLGLEGYLLRTAGQKIVIAGSPVRGTLYGIYGLLDDVWGCRWYTAKVSRIPKYKKLALPRLNQTWVPALEYRESYWTEGWDADWAARNRQNSSHARLEDKHGGKITYAGHFVHTLDQMVPVEHYAKHPEYFTFRNGRRHDGSTQRCLTNPDVLKLTIAKVRQILRANPKANIISVSQNDNFDYCECEKCKALDTAEGSHAGTMITFVNAVAKAIEREFPHVAVDTLAYQYTRKPPKTVRPRHNVIVRLCSIECCFSHPLDGCPEDSNTSFVRDLKGWARVHKRLYIWDYVTDFVHYLLPFPNLDVLDKNIHTFVTNGVAGMFEQGNYSKGGTGAHCDLKLWVIGRMLWDPKLKVAPLIAEFVRGVYGPAAKPVMESLNLIRKGIKRSGEHVRIFDGPMRKYITPAIVRSCDRLLGRAEDIAKKAGDRALLSRIERMRMPIWYTQTAQVKEKPEVLKVAIRRLHRAIKAQKLTHITEWRPLEPDIKRMYLAAIRKPVTPEVPGTIVGEDNLFTYFGGIEALTVVADKDADDGVAARQPGAWKSGSIQWDVPGEPAGKRFRLRARIKVEKRNDKGPAFGVVLYDAVTGKNALELSKDAIHVPNGEYRWHDVGEFVMRPGLFVWVAPCGNDASIIAVYTDRIELVPISRK